MIKWLRSIYVKGDFLGRVLANGGSFLNRSFEELEDIIGYLESCGVRRDWIGYVVSRCPQLLNMSMDELETRVRFYTDMGMDEKDFGTMVYDYPRALGFLSLEEMNSKVFALCLVLLLCLFRCRLNTGRIISPSFMLFIFCSLI
jgi:mTERF domain-containing protein